MPPSCLCLFERDVSTAEREVLSKRMLFLCEMLDWPRVRRALWFGADPFYAELRGQTVMHFAALADDFDTVVRTLNPLQSSDPRT